MSWIIPIHKSKEVQFYRQHYQQPFIQDKRTFVPCHYDMKILIIDDDPEDTMLFCEAIHEILPSATCITEHSCQDIARIFANTQPVNVVFVDGFMYPFGGVECLKTLRNILGASSDTKVVIYSGGISPAQMEEFKACGVDDILIKPASYESLKTNLSRLLKEKYQLSER